MDRTDGTATLWGGRAFVSPDTFDALVALLGRLEAAVDAETAELRRHGHAGLPAATLAKRQGLLELDRLARTMTNTIPSQDLIARLALFRGKLAANAAALAIELRAAGEVNATVVRALREAESDGTYSRAAAAPAAGGRGGYGWD